MTFLVWREYLETGLPEIDEQHHRLVDLVNALGPSLAGASDIEPATRRALLAELVDYAIVHFRDEEALMARAGLAESGFAHHRATHARFAERIGQRVAAVEAGESGSGDALLSMLSSWLLLHILGEDQAMARQVRLLRAGHSPGEARREGRGTDLSPDPAALSRAMVDVYVLLSRQNREARLALSEVRRQRELIAGHNATLEHTVRERTRSLEALARDLTRARDDAQAADRAKGRILGTVGHELRTPLNAIAGHAHALRGAALPAAQRASLEAISRAGERLTELVDSVMAFAGDEAPREPLVFRPAALLAGAADRARAQVAGRPVEVQAEVDPAVPPSLCGDPVAVEQALRHLVDNAAKYTERGTIRIAVRPADTGAEPVRLRFEVEDSGIGIEKARLDVLFEAFGQPEDHLVRRHEGLGLGLAIARKLALRLGGTLVAESRPGSGSRFTLEAPFLPAPAPRPEAALPDDPAAEAWLDTLARRLGESDVRAIGLVDRMPEPIRERLGGMAGELARHVAAFDFESAARVLDHTLTSPRIAQRERP